MKDCKTLGQAARILIPEYFDKIDWNGIWNRKLETGSAFEWAVLAAMIRAARLHGAQVSVPLLDSFQAGEFFILRNEIPLSHGAQAGNSATALPSKSLKDRFFYSLIAQSSVLYSRPGLQRIPRRLPVSQNHVRPELFGAHRYYRDSRNNPRWFSPLQPVRQ